MLRERGGRGGVGLIAGWSDTLEREGEGERESGSNEDITNVMNLADLGRAVGVSVSHRQLQLMSLARRR